MSTAQELIGAGQLSRALEVLSTQVRSEPHLARPRAALAEMLLILGDWARAEQQLNVIRDLDARYLPMVETCRMLIACEVQRGEVLAGARPPVVVDEPPGWLAALVGALELDAARESVAAAEQRRRAFSEASPVGGTLNGKPFAWVADADARFGPVLEMMVGGRYHWVPFERLRAVTIEPPTALRDLVWTPVRVEWGTGVEQAGHVPVRYPGTELLAEPELQLARETRWLELANDLAAGLGQKVLATDQDLHGLLEINRLELLTGAA